MISLDIQTPPEVWYLDPKNIPSKHRSPQEVFAWMSTEFYNPIELRWEHHKPCRPKKRPARQEMFATRLQRPPMDANGQGNNFVNGQDELRRLGMVTPLKIKMDPQNEGLEDVFPFHFGVIFRFQPFVFWGVSTKNAQELP